MRQEYHVISHQNFERVRFDIKEKYDMVIMEGHCRNCNQYWYRGGNIVEYLKAIALHPTNPIMARCPTCNIDDSSTIHIENMNDRIFNIPVRLYKLQY
jgi:hypothetical protein